jgi:formate dehydrogenase major subunit
MHRDKASLPFGDETMLERIVSVVSQVVGEVWVVARPSFARLAVVDGSRVRVWSRRGEVTLPVRESTDTQPGSVFIPFHFREAAANVLTTDVLDPDGKIPEFKFCAVAVEPVDA